MPQRPRDPRTRLQSSSASLATVSSSSPANAFSCSAVASGGIGTGAACAQRWLPAVLGGPSAYDPGGRPRHHGMVRHRAPDHGTGGDHDVPSDPRPRQDHRAGPDPAARPDLHRLHPRPLLADGLVGIVVGVIGGRHVDIRPEVAVAADADRGVGDDVAAAPEHDSVADAQDRLRAEVQVRHQTGGQGDLLADDAVGADMDPRLTEHRAQRKGQAAVRAQRAEAEAPRALGRDRAGALHPGPARVDGTLYEAAPPG